MKRYLVPRGRWVTRFTENNSAVETIISTRDSFFTDDDKFSSDANLDASTSTLTFKLPAEAAPFVAFVVLARDVERL